MMDGPMPAHKALEMLKEPMLGVPGPIVLLLQVDGDRAWIAPLGTPYSTAADLADLAWLEVTGLAPAPDDVWPDG
jgi:hypothetical protein